MKKLTRERVVPIMSANASWVIGGIKVSSSPGLPNEAINKRVRARRFSLELNNWSTKSAWVRTPRASRKRTKICEKLTLKYGHRSAAEMVKTAHSLKNVVKKT